MTTPTPEQEDALVAKFWKEADFDSISEACRLAIRAAYAQGVAQERERCAMICDRECESAKVDDERYGSQEDATYFGRYSAAEDLASAIRKGEE